MTPSRHRSRRPAARSGRSGFSLLELMVCLGLLMVVMLPLGQFFIQSSRTCISLTKAVHTTSQALAVLDRLGDELLTGNMVSLVPPVPVSSSSIAFQKIVDVAGGTPVYGNRVNIDLVPLESIPADGLDNDGDGLIDEAGARIWQDLPPDSVSPGPEDVSTIVCANLASNGLLFTRQAGAILIDMTIQEVRKFGAPPATTTLRSGVKMRNGE